MRPSTNFTLFAAALSLYLAPFALATEQQQQQEQHQQVARSLNDQNLFEAHLSAHAETSHKRLPSEVLQQHHERDEQEHPSTTPIAPASSVDTSADVPHKTVFVTPHAAGTKKHIPFSARQPSHFIKSYRKQQGKRRLSSSLQYKRDTDDWDAMWTLPATVSQSSVDEENSTTNTEAVASSVHADASSRLVELEHSTLAALQALNQRLRPNSNHSSP